MSALPCLTNTRPGVSFFALSDQGGGGIPANPDITCSSITVNGPGFMSTIGAGGASLALLSKASEGGVRVLGDNGTDATTLTVANLNVSSINGTTPGGGGGAGPDPVVSTLTFPASNLVSSGVINMKTELTINDPDINNIQCFGFQTDTTGAGPPYANNISSINTIYINGPVGSAKNASLNLSAGSDGNCYIGVGNNTNGTSTLSLCAEAVGISSLLVSSINGSAAGGGATISSIGLVAPFNTGPSTSVIVQVPASPSPPTQFTTAFDLQANTVYNLAANLNYQFSNSITNSNVYMGMRLTNGPANVVFSPPDYQIGYQNLQGWAPSWTIATGNSTFTNVQMDLLLQFENNVSNISSFITPPTPSGYAVTLTTLGSRPL